MRRSRTMKREKQKEVKKKVHLFTSRNALDKGPPSLSVTSFLFPLFLPSQSASSLSSSLLSLPPFPHFCSFRVCLVCVVCLWNSSVSNKREEKKKKPQQDSTCFNSIWTNMQLDLKERDWMKVERSPDRQRRRVCLSWKQEKKTKWEISAAQNGIGWEKVDHFHVPVFIS